MAVFVPKKPFIEVIVVWEGEFFKHIAADLWDASTIVLTPLIVSCDDNAELTDLGIGLMM